MNPPFRSANQEGSTKPGPDTPSDPSIDHASCDGGDFLKAFENWIDDLDDYFGVSEMESGDPDSVENEGSPPGS